MSTWKAINLHRAQVPDRPSHEAIRVQGEPTTDRLKNEGIFLQTELLFAKRDGIKSCLTGQYVPIAIAVFAQPCSKRSETKVFHQF